MRLRHLDFSLRGPGQQPVDVRGRIAYGNRFERDLKVGMRVAPVYLRRFDLRGDASPGRGTAIAKERVL